MPTIPSFGLLRQSLLNVLLTVAGAIVIMMLLSRFLLTTPLYRRMIATSASGATADANIVAEQKTRLGEIGTAVSALRPGGKAQFGDAILDVISQGELIPKSTQVRIIAFSGREPIVELVKSS
jgi:membrane-bound serine protease (ClpP class)